MTDYKTIRGKKIKSFATDLGNDQAEGQIFYSSTDNQFKTVVATGAWHSGGNLSVPRTLAGISGGTQTASLAYAGYLGGPGNSNSTEEYNGTGWGSGGNVNTARRGGAGVGVQTAALLCGGYSTSPTTFVEEYDGSSWSEVTNIPADVSAGAGIQTAALIFNESRNSFYYDGSSWTTSTTLPAAMVGGTGLQTAALAVIPPPSGTSTLEWDGSSWTAGGSYNTARPSGLGGMTSGTQTSAITAGTRPSPPSARVGGITEQYDGTSWATSSATQGTPRNSYMTSAANNTSALIAGGSPYTTATEEFNQSVNVVTAAAFSAGGNLNTARQRGTGGGTLTAGICVNGITVDVEEYNGTSWSEQNNMPTALRDPSGFGTQTAFVGCAGYNPGTPNTGNTYEYDGSNWTSGGTMNVARDGTSIHFGGVLTAGLVNGGGLPPYKQTEEYNGTSWSNANASSQHHYRTNITGTQTAAFIFGGYGIDPGGPQAGASVTFTEEYDGTNFSSGDSLLQGANAPLGMSNSNKDDSTCAGGFDQASGSRLSLTQNYNGTAWATGASLGTARYAGTGGGSAAGGFVASGNVPPTTAATEELTAETTSLNLKTITDS